MKMIPGINSHLAAATVLLLIVLAPSIYSQPVTLISPTEIWPPYRFQGEDGSLQGIDIDLLEAIGMELGVEIDVQRHPFARALEMIRGNQADVITGIAWTEQRAEYIDYSTGAYSRVQPVFYARNEDAEQIREYEDLYGRTVGYSLNSAYFEPFNSDDRLTKVGLSTEAQVLSMLALGRVDLIIGTNPNLAYDIRKAGLSESLKQTAYVPPIETPLFLGFPRNGRHADLYRQIDNLLSQMIEDGRMEAILARYR